MSIPMQQSAPSAAHKIRTTGGMSRRAERQHGTLSFLTWSFFLATFLKMDLGLGGHAIANTADGEASSHGGSDDAATPASNFGSQAGYTSLQGSDGGDTNHAFVPTPLTVQQVGTDHVDAGFVSPLALAMLPPELAAGSVSAIISSDDAQTSNGGIGPDPATPSDGHPPETPVAPVASLPPLHVDPSPIVEHVGEIIGGVTAVIPEVTTPVLSIVTSVISDIGDITASLPGVNDLTHILGGTVGGILGVVPDILHDGASLDLNGLLGATTSGVVDTVHNVVAQIPTVSDVIPALTASVSDIVHSLTEAPLTIASSSHTGGLVGASSGSSTPLNLIDTVLSDVGISAGGNLSFTHVQLHTADDFGLSTSGYSQYGIALNAQADASVSDAAPVAGDDASLSAIVSTALGHGPVTHSQDLGMHSSIDFQLHLLGGSGDSHAQHLGLFG